MQRKTKWIVGGALSAAVVVGGTGTGLAAAGGDDDKPLTGTTLDRAVTAARDATDGGTVTETEAGDDGATSSVEIRRPDGSQVEVNLDGNFAVTGQEADDDANDGPDDDGPDDDGPDDGPDDDGPDDDGPDDGPDDDGPNDDADDGPDDDGPNDD